MLVKLMVGKLVLGVKDRNDTAMAFRLVIIVIVVVDNE